MNHCTAHRYWLHLALAVLFFAVIPMAIWHNVGSAHAQNTKLQAMAWSQIPAEQQKVLAPFKEQWASMSPQEQQQWTFLSAHYKHLSADDKTKHPTQRQEA